MLVCQWIGLASLWVLDNHVAINMGIARIEQSIGRSVHGTFQTWIWMHPDDASGVIIEAVWRRLQGR